MHIITGGCSFTEGDNNNPSWPQLLTQSLKFFDSRTHTAKAMQDNGMIMRKAMHAVHKLKKQNKTDILLLVMWSGFSRHSYISISDDYISKQNTMTEGVADWIYNSQGVDLEGNVVQDNQTPGWMYWSPRFLHTSARLEEHAWKFTNSYSDWEKTTQYMISLQNFCVANGVKYYWATFDNKWEDFYKHVILKNNLSTLSWMWGEINFKNRFLKAGMWDWVNKLNSHNIFHKAYKPDGFHPSAESHNYMVNNELIPFLKQNCVY